MTQSIGKHAPAQDRTSEAKAKLVEVMQYMRDGAQGMDDPRGAALFETTAEVLQGLVAAHDHYERKSEAAWHGATTAEQAQRASGTPRQRQRPKSAQPQTGADLPTITREELRNRMDSGHPTVILDARPSEAWDASESKLPGAVRIQPEAPEVSMSAPDGSVVVIYASDSSNGHPAVINIALADAGFADVFALEGGFDAWQAADYPLENKTVQEKQAELNEAS